MRGHSAILLFAAAGVAADDSQAKIDPAAIVDGNGGGGHIAITNVTTHSPTRNPMFPGGHRCPRASDINVWVDPKSRNKLVDAEADGAKHKWCESDHDCTYERYCAYDDHCEKDPHCTDYDAKNDLLTGCRCLHKNLVPKHGKHGFSWRDGCGLASIFVGCMLAASAGIGGGGLFVPIFMLINGFAIEEAIPLSHATVMGNSVAQLFVNFPLRHTDHQFVTTEKFKPIIDYSVPLLLLPGQLGGNNLGVLLDPLIPADILIIFSELLLAFATWRVFSKGYQMYLNENKALEESALLGSGAVDDDDEQPSHTQNGPAGMGPRVEPNLMADNSLGRKTDGSHSRDRSRQRSQKSTISNAYSQASEASVASIGAAYVGLPKEDNESDYGLSAEERYAEYERDNDQEKKEEFEAVEAIETSIPLNYVGAMFVFWCFFAAAYVAKSEFKKCSAGYFVVLIALYPILIAVTCGGAWMVKKHAARRKEIGVRAPRGEVKWEGSKLYMGPLAALFVGLVAGLLGLGGGELMAPLLLELGLMPKAASSTSAYMIIWTTSSNMVNYGVGKSLHPQYGICFCLLGFVGGGAGRFLAINFIKGRQSPIAFFLGSVLSLSMALMAYRVAVAKPNWTDFGSLC